MGSLRLLPASVLLFVFLANASAKEHLESAPDTLRALIRESLTILKAGKAPTQLDAITKIFKELDRGRMDSDMLVEIKYLMSVFRAAVVELRLAQLATATPEDARRIAADIRTIGGFLSVPQARQLISVGELPTVAERGDPEGVYKLLEEKGDAEAKRLMGPRILPYDGSGYLSEVGNDGWLGKPGFDLSAYKATGKYSAMVRGLEVRSGDIFLLDQGVTGGINTNFSLPRSYATHMGLIVFVEVDGKVYPSFLEIADRGLRVVPLNTALAPRFSAYGEVFRPVGVQNFPTWAKKLSDDVRARLKVKYFYDFYATPVVTGEETDVVCSTQVQLFLMRHGIHLKLPVSRIDPNAVRNLRTQLDSPLTEYVTPTSYLQAGNDQVIFVGTVDNGMARINVAREMVVGAPADRAPGSLGDLFSRYSLDVDRISPFSQKGKFHLLDWIVPGVLMTGMFQAKAPGKLIAFSEILQAPLSEAIKTLAKDFDNTIHDTRSYEPFSLSAKSQDPEFVRLLGTKMAPIRGWFVENPREIAAELPRPGASGKPETKIK